jgi:glycosyltransferase involved in cell wall biosynthesis
MSAPDSTTAPTPRRRLVCFVNGIFAEGIGGGDTYFAYMVQAALAAGYPIHFFGGHALRRYLEKRGFPMNLTLTDARPGRLGDVSRLGGQFRLLFDFARRLYGSLHRLDHVQEDDIAYAMSDYWFDTLPLIRCPARTKILYLGMIAPTLGEVIFRRRADVTPSRLASLYYWMSQRYSLWRFLRCPGGQVTYSHPEMKDYLMGLGYAESALHYVPNGSDVEAADRVPPQPREFDVAWTGRVHPQKGIADLLALLVWLKNRIPDYRAVIIGKSRDALEPSIRAMGLAGHVTFSGLVSEEEKYRLLKASRVFVMPSRYESWGIVVGEALVAGTPVVAYELGCYRPVFGDFVRYAPPFNRQAWFQAVEHEIREMRAGRNYLDGMGIKEFKPALSWTEAQKAFVNTLDSTQRSVFFVV